MDLTGRKIIITGVSRGLGTEIARQCVRYGASVFACGRDAELLAKTESELNSIASAGQNVGTMRTDVGDPEQVKTFVDTAVAKLGGVTGLINNAGMNGPKGRAEELDWSEWTETIRVNLFGTVLCCREAIPHFRRAGYGKIVNLSGGGATAPMPRFSAYAASKAAVVRFTETLARENDIEHIDVNAVAPGAMNTRMLDEVLEAGPEKVGLDYYERSIKQRDSGGASLENAADLCAFLVSSASDGISGRLISAVWDPWRDLPSHLQEFARTDVYTLRRIIPKERGFDWGDPK